jgi:predicted transcriptional regulator of viral defense system
MGTLIEHITNAGLGERVVTETQLSRLLDGTPQRRYSLINRALHRGDLLRLRRGRYLLSSAVKQGKVHPFVLAQALLPGSYISMETALSFHGWIPESTPITMCITPDRRRRILDIPKFGQFHYYPLALNTGWFLEGVDRDTLAGQSCLIAQPLRALLDILCLRKIDYPGIRSLTEGMRIDEYGLASIDSDDLERMRPVYQHKRMDTCISAMQRELKQ